MNAGRAHAFSVPVLAIDAGNTRVKWGLRVGDDWAARGADRHRRSVEARAATGRRLPPGTRALASNVGGPAVQARLYEACARHDLLLALIASPREQLGVTNGYRDAAPARHRSLGRAHRRAPCRRACTSSW